MAPDWLEPWLLTLYFLPAAVLMLYGLNLYVMMALYLLRRKPARAEARDLRRIYRDCPHAPPLPAVCTQLPVYNEANVAERAIRAVAAIDYPPDRHHIQVLDDSTDATRDLIDQTVRDLQREGENITVLRRESRTGFKAGALEEGMRQSDADFFAIFDADFVPGPQYLRNTVPIMMMKPDVGLVQARWGHLNANRSLLTRAQAIGIDGHFTIEQPARAWNSLFMNFNGTAGLWRRAAITDAGGWEHDTLTEDMDLSYRSQLAGWKPYFVWDEVVPAELPENINAFKSQQFRWAKGSMQTAIKLLPRVFRSNASAWAKIQSVFHMTHYIVHPVMLWLSIMALPVLTLTSLVYNPLLFAGFVALILLTTMAPSFLYGVSQCLLYRRGWTRLRYLPFLTSLGIGIALSNTRAVWEALRGKHSEFVRTPKAGEKTILTYSARMPVVAMLELLLGAYCFASLNYFLNFHEYLLGPFLLLYASGFSLVGILSLVHGLSSSPRKTA